METPYERYSCAAVPQITALTGVLASFFTSTMKPVRECAMASISLKSGQDRVLPLYRIIHSSGEILVRNLRQACQLGSERPGARIFRVDTSSWRDEVRIELT